jgi:hypothetical protein
MTALVDFEPLRRAERILLRACARGDIARVGLRRPSEPLPELSVRAGLIAYLAAGGGPDAPVRGRRLQLLGAWIEGRLDCGEQRVPASLWFYRCVFDTTPLFDGARVDGSLSFPDCGLPGLQAERCRIAEELALNAGCSLADELRLQRARIGGDLKLSRLSLRGSDGAMRRPLQADGARIGGDVRLDEGVEANGELCFAGARVGGDFRAGGARLTGSLDATGTRRAALVLDRIEVTGDLRLDAGFAASGRVCLRRARIGGDLDGSGAAFDRVGDAAWDDGSSLVLDRARIGGSLRLRGLQAPLIGASLAHARVGSLDDDASTWGERLVLDGFVYARFGDGAPQDTVFRLDWLECQPAGHLGSDFRVHPWQRLIEVMQRSGRRHTAGAIAIQRERLLRRIGHVGAAWPAALRWLGNGVHLLSETLFGHGWRPQRLAGWWLAVWLLGAGVFWAAAEHGAMAPTSAAARSKATPPFSPLVYAGELMLPLVDLQQRRAWAPSTRPVPVDGLELFDWAAGARLVGWGVTLFGWGATALLLAWLAGGLPRDHRLAGRRR